jgi:hypothetical protein
MKDVLQLKRDKNYLIDVTRLLIFIHHKVIKLLHVKGENMCEIVKFVVLIVILSTFFVSANLNCKPVFIIKKFSSLLITEYIVSFQLYSFHLFFHYRA